MNEMLVPVTNKSVELATVGTQRKQYAKIDQSAKDFESLLLGNWLQQAEESFAKVPGGGSEDEADDATNQLQGIAMQALGTAMTAAGGVGLARVISDQLHTVEQSAAAAKGRRQIQ
ncbi:MAG: hypothetical protein P4L10_08230 [Acidobacteriaceae bacterium]|nr:hypothetical protein [Acidobacteriaceae bacterium]